MMRVKTHISGFDELIQGGFVKGSDNLLLGNAGTGKTIFSLEYLYNGAKFDKEVGIYFTFEEKREDLIEQAKQFGWDFVKLEKQGKIKIISLGFEDISKGTIDEIIEIIESVKAKRVVIDSISTLTYLTPEKRNFGDTNLFEIKKFIYMFIAKMRNLNGTTSILISQNENNEVNSVAKYLSESIINIKYETLGGDYSRNLSIRKIRKTKNNEDLHPLEICDKGIIIHNL